MEKREPVRIFRNRQSRFVHQLTGGKVCQQKTIELLPHQIRRLAAQDDMRSPQVGLEFVERGFDLPAFVIERRQFGGRRRFVVEDRGRQPI